MKVLFVIYDNDSYMSWFPLGVAYLAAIIRDKGHSVLVEKYNVMISVYRGEGNGIGSLGNHTR